MCERCSTALPGSGGVSVLDFHCSNGYAMGIFIYNFYVVVKNITFTILTSAQFISVDYIHMVMHRISEPFMHPAEALHP